MKHYNVDHFSKTKEYKEKYNKTSLKRYGVNHPSQSDIIKKKHKTTCLEKYGVDHQFKSNIVKDKRKTVMMEKYGVDHVSKIDDVKNKKIQKSREKYGTDYGFQSDEIKKKTKETNNIKYGCDFSSQFPIVQNKGRQTRKTTFFNRVVNSKNFKLIVAPNFQIEDYNFQLHEIYSWKCVKCGIVFDDYIYNGHIPRCPKCYPIFSGTSSYEKEICEWLSLSKINYIQNSRNLISPYELDIYIPNYNLAIEFDGLYWHSESKGKTFQYHLNKTNMCKEQGIQLLHIFEDEWINKSEIVKSVVLSKLGIYKEKIFGRKCQIKKIDNNEAKIFLSDNHLQGKNNGIHIGLYYKEELVQILTMSKSRYNKKYEWEILRSCTKINKQVIGGLSKLLSYFIKQFNPNSIITYVDRRYSSGKGYSSSGFEFVNESNPNYYYMKNYQLRESRIKYQKHKLSGLLETFDPNLTEWENMQLNGYDRIWDCGNYVFSWYRK